MEGNQMPAVEGKKRTFLQRLHNTRLILWWSVAWAVGTFALAPLVNYITPFLNPSYANQWTPDIYWRLVMYWHGAIFIPWIVVLAVLVTTRFHLDQMAGLPGRLIGESVFVGGFFAVPIAGIAGVFDVYDQFAAGIPLWTQIFAFLIGDEIAIALLLAMLAYPRRNGGYLRAGMPYYTAFTGVVGAFAAAMMGHVGGWITWFGPNPGIVNNYINATEYPVLGFSNSTSVVTFTQGVVTSHSHLMLISLMAGVVALVAIVFGYYETWGKNQKRVATFGFSVMIAALLFALWMYVVSGVGNYQVPNFFVNGANGVAADDMTTGTVGLGAVFVLAGLISHSRGSLTAEGRPLIRDPLFLAVIFSWVTIYLVIPVTGFYINFNENFFKFAGISFDDAFNRFHQDFGFYLLPSLVTLLLTLQTFGVTAKVRRYVGYFSIAGIATAFVFGESYTLSTATYTTPYVGQVYTALPMASLFLAIAFLGGALIAVGGLVAAFYVRGTAPSLMASLVSPKPASPGNNAVPIESPGNTEPPVPYLPTPLGSNVETEPGKPRILADIRTMEEAQRVEESIKTGYVEPIIENIVNWIGAEEDLADSYEKFSKALPSSEEQKTANALYVLSNSDADVLRRRLEEFEGFDSEYRKRIKLVKHLTKKA